MNATNNEKEQQQGRLAVWLSPDQVAFLANEWRKIPENVESQIKAHWATIAFRCMAVLHKSDISYTPQFPQDNEKYHLPHSLTEQPTTIETQR